MKIIKSGASSALFFLLFLCRITKGVKGLPDIATMSEFFGRFVKVEPLSPCMGRHALSISLPKMNRLGL